MLQLQTLLEAKPVNLEHVRTLLEDAFKALEDDLNAQLVKMVDNFRDSQELAKACGAIGANSPLQIDWSDPTKTRESQRSREQECMLFILTPFVDDMRRAREAANAGLEGRPFSVERVGTP